MTKYKIQTEAARMYFQDLLRGTAATFLLGWSTSPPHQSPPSHHSSVVLSMTIGNVPMENSSAFMA